MSHATLKHFRVFFDRYYWKTAVLIAKNGLARQYRNSYLGMLWTLLQPLAMVFVYAIIMPLIMNMRMSNYPLYMIASLPLWGFFSSALFSASQSILANGETLKRCMISSTVFPVADILRLAYMFVISFCTMYSVCLVLFVGPDPVLLLLPLYFIPVVMIVGSLSIGIAFIAPYIRDIGDLITLSMNMLMWFTPVIYKIEILPTWAQRAMQWNPFYVMLHPIQMIAYDRVAPGWHEIYHLILLTVIAILVGFGIFKACRRNYVYYL